MKRVAILISGSGSNMAALADAMVGSFPARPCVVVSNIAGAGGLAKARMRDIEAVTLEHKGLAREVFEARLTEALERCEPDIICLAGFMRILTPGFIARWRGRMLNIHPSLLPKYPGLHTHARALEAGDAEAGCSVHEVTEALDGGPVLGQARVRVRPGDTPETLAARVLAEEHRLYPAVLARFARGDRTPVLFEAVA